VAVPLSDTEATLSHLLVLELIVSGAILLALAAATWLVVRLGLRPLEEMADTAGEIAAGDLSQRVDDTDERTETGRLGAALNVMLGRIESAFREREASEARLRRFVADASHELRTPLTSIRGYAELFRHGLADRPADLGIAMRRIDSESTRMAVLVDDLLLLARLDQGRPLDREPLDLSVLARDAEQDARAVDSARSITADVPRATLVLGDELRLRQLVGNLMSNALAHTPPGSPIEIAIRHEPGSRVATAATAGATSTSAAAPLSPLASNGAAPAPLPDRVVLSIVDHGPGVPEEARARVFERFWRSDPSRERSRGGTGLGLSIVAAIAEAHGGAVSVAETPGGGATFVVSLPRVAPADADLEPDVGATLGEHLASDPGRLSDPAPGIGLSAGP